MPTVSERYDIKSLIEQHAGIRVTGQAVVRGVREYHSNCPWCGGKDRFVTRPDTGQYTCSIRDSGCGRHGDGIDFLVEYAHMTRQEAIEELALEHVSFAESRQTRQQETGKDAPPSTKWQETGWTLVERAERLLWSPSGRRYLDYLRDRGLTDDTIKRKRYGYVPLQSDGSWAQFSFEDWGLDPATLTPAQQERGCVRVPPGILMPWIETCGVNILWRLTMKRPDEKQKDRRYGQILGGSPSLYNIDALAVGKVAIMIEGEIDADSIDQEAGDLVAAVATGSSTNARLPRWIADLSLSSVTLQAYDEDESGDEGANYWLNTLRYCMRWSPMLWKDANELLQAERAGAALCTLRDWVQYGIDAAKKEFPERFAAPVPSIPSISPLQGEIMESMPMPDSIPDYSRYITAQAHYERLRVSTRVQTPDGSGAFWDEKQLRAQLEEHGKVSVVLDGLLPYMKIPGARATRYYRPEELQPLLEIEASSLQF